MAQNTNANSKLFLEGLLGLLSAFGPFVMDMYLSAFPLIADFYNASPSMVQLSLAACTVGLALGQFVFGAVSDSFGRKTPLLFSLILYVVTSVGCIFSPTIWLFISMRFFQGLAAAGGVVISRSIAADCYSGSALAKMFGIIGMINGVSTVVAPMFGGFVVEAWGWKSVFWLLMSIGIVMGIGTICFRESLPVESRIKLTPAALIAGVKRVCSNHRFISATVQYGFVMALIFVNLASGPFIMNEYGMSAEQISIVFGVNAIAIAIAAGVASRFRDMRKVLRMSNVGVVVFSIFLAITLVCNMGFWLYEVALFSLYLFVGAMCTSSTTLAMDSERKNAGIASAFFGAVGYVAGGITSPLVGIGSVFTTAAILFVALAVIAIILSFRNKALNPE